MEPQILALFCPFSSQSHSLSHSLRSWQIPVFLTGAESTIGSEQFFSQCKHHPKPSPTACVSKMDMVAAE
jgi:hypothetical protein